jgi:small-conductance mechanosensitive channel
MESRAESAVVAEQEKKSVRGILVFVKIVLWVLAFILVMDNLGVKVTTFVAGLGIGGIAIALAAQAILGDLFSYFVIFFDRPFQVGHFIKIGAFMGEVEAIGIKTTRIRSLTGETIIMSNKYLTDNQVQNFRLMTRRRLTALFEVEYGTPNPVLREIPAVVRGVVESAPAKAASGPVTFDRCHFKEFADSGLRFELVYFVEVPEMATAMDVQQEVNLGIKEALDVRKIGFAFPTRTLHLVTAEGQGAGEGFGKGDTAAGT